VSIVNRDRWTLLNWDCTLALKKFPDCTFDALVTDPPAGIGFMGKDWDGDKGGRDQWVAWLAGVARECLRVLKPGAHGLVWSIPRTSHWTAWALEDAGFEVRDRIAHFFGTGFPKSLNVGQGRGTALKPAVEDWWLVRKPLVGTVAKNVAAHGTGALNIDACRIASGDAHTVGRANSGGKGEVNGTTYGASKLYDSEAHAAGRWPAHLTLDEEAAALLDAQSGHLEARGNRTAKDYGSDYNATSYAFGGRETGKPFDSGGASRFFYVAKPSSAERDAGCESLPVKSGGEATDRTDGSAGVENPRAGAGRGGGRRNFHPTVKPVALMRWLCRLITPPGGVVLDPFAGSGTTGVAALAEGFRFVGIEASAEYFPITVARLSTADQIPDSE
jgi:hypothetical protein